MFQFFFEYEELRDETGAKRRSATSCVDLRHFHPSNFKIGFFLSYNKLRAAAPRAARRSRRVAPQGRFFFLGGCFQRKITFFRGEGGYGFSRPSSLFLPSLFSLRFSPKFTHFYPMLNTVPELFFHFFETSRIGAAPILMHFW